MSFCTAINCMDGRVQLPVITFLQEKFDAEYVDSITEPGPNAILSIRENSQLVQSIVERLTISVEKHGSVGIAVTGHYDCAGNPAHYEKQIDHINESVRFVQNLYNGIDVIGLWINNDFEVEEI